MEDNPINSNEESEAMTSQDTSLDGQEISRLEQNSAIMNTTLPGEVVDRVLAEDSEKEKMAEVAGTRREDIIVPGLSENTEKDTTIEAAHRPEGNETPRPNVDTFEESAEARLERLGRQRPEAFDSVWSEIGFVFSISMSQVLSVSSLNSLPMSQAYDVYRNTSYRASRSFSPH